MCKDGLLTCYPCPIHLESPRGGFTRSARSAMGGREDGEREWPVPTTADVAGVEHVTGYLSLALTTPHSNSSFLSRANVWRNIFLGIWAIYTSECQDDHNPGRPWGGPAALLCWYLSLNFRFEPRTFNHSKFRPKMGSSAGRDAI